MAIAHYGAAKLVFLVSASVATAIVAMDPTMKGWIVGGCVIAIPNIIKGVFDYVMQSRTLAGLAAVHHATNEIKGDMIEVKKSVDGVKDDLVRAVKKEAFAAGEKKERDDPHTSGGS
jgi:hypothetical protein